VTTRCRKSRASLFALAVLAAACLAANTASAAPSAPWTLDRALEAADAASPDARIARHRIAAAAAMLDQASAGRMPQVSLHGGYTQTNNPMAAFGSILGQREFDFALDFNDPGRVDNLRLAATVAYSIYDGGRTSSATAAARLGERAATEQDNAARLRLHAAVVRALLDIRKAHAAVGAVEAGVRAYESALAAARARADAGRILRADLLDLEVQLAQTRENLIQARHRKALAERAFLFVVGSESTGERVVLAEDDPGFDRIRLPDTTAPAARPELLALEAARDAAARMVDGARGTRRPTVNAFASVQHDRGWETGGDGASWTAGVAVDMNVFDGGAARGRIRASEAALAEAEENLRRARLAIGLEVEQARLAHEQALARIEVTRSAVSQARESASLSRARFEEGALEASDLIGVETRLIEAETREAVALADERIALADLRRSLGLPPVSTL
jgi:outer membrane protein TolC